MILEQNGFVDVTPSADLDTARKVHSTILWSTSTIKSDVYQSLTKDQKVNHFPRSYEITRKDLFFQRIARMQALYGRKHFDFIP
jgi:hypothetical protein